VIQMFYIPPLVLSYSPYVKKMLQNSSFVACLENLQVMFCTSVYTCILLGSVLQMRSHQGSKIHCTRNCERNSKMNFGLIFLSEFVGSVLHCFFGW
jgi:hypothetical protein